MEYSETPGLVKLGFLFLLVGTVITIIFFIFIEGSPISNAKYEMDYDSDESPPPHKIKNIEKGEYEIWYERWPLEKNSGDPGEITITSDDGNEVELESAGGDFDGYYFRIHIVDINKTGEYNISVENPCLLFLLPHDTSDQDLVCQITTGIFMIALVFMGIGYFQYRRRKKAGLISTKSDVREIPDIELKKEIFDYIKANPYVDHASLSNNIKEATGCSGWHFKINLGELIIEKYVERKDKKLKILKELEE